MENKIWSKKRKDCINGVRPCPWIRCKNHIVWLRKDQKKFWGNTDEKILDIVWNLKYSCVLDAIDAGGMSLDEIGHLTGLTRERVRQIEGLYMEKDRKTVMAKIRKSKLGQKLWRELNEE